MKPRAAVLVFVTLWAGAGPAQADGLCERCAVVTGVRSLQRAGGDALPGGLAMPAGHRLGQGAGLTLEDAAGVQRAHRRGTVWITSVRLKNGRTRSFEARQHPGLRTGDVVVVDDATLRRHIREPARR